MKPQAIVAVLVLLFATIGMIAEAVISAPTISVSPDDAGADGPANKAPRVPSRSR